MKILLESTVIGICTVIIGTVISLIISKFMKMDLPSVCKNWNKNYVMEWALFLTGFFLHLLFEFVGINRWYCLNYKR